MIRDAGLKLTVAQADVRNAGTYLGQNGIAVGHARGIQVGHPLDLICRVGTAFAGGTSVEFQLVQADDAALTTNKEVILSSGAIAEAKLTADTIVFKGPMPRKVSRAYIGIQATGVGTHTAGTFDAELVERAPMSPSF